MVSAGILIVSCGQSGSDLKDDIGPSNGTFTSCQKYETKTYDKIDFGCASDADTGSFGGGVVGPGQRQYIQTWGINCMEKTYKDGKEIDSKRADDYVISEKKGECE